MRVLISGASGLVGTALSAALQTDGVKVSRLIRPGTTAAPGDIPWDPGGASIELASMEGADAVVNLSGASIAGGRWTPERKSLLRSSRIGTTHVLVDALAKLHQKPKVFLCASAIGFYGDRGDDVLTEQSHVGSGFLAKLARDWEVEAAQAETAGIRTVSLRFGIVLSENGGALAKMLTPFRVGLGGRLGGGKQWMSWIALQDAVAAIRLAMTDEKLRGPVNVVAPAPVRNEEFTKILARTLHKPAIFPAPALALRLMLGEMADALLLSSQRVKPEGLMSAGFRFRFEMLADAFGAILR